MLVAPGKTARETLAQMSRIQLQPLVPDAQTLTDAELADSIYYTVFPNFHPWGAYNRIVYRFRPYQNQPNRSIMESVTLNWTVATGPAGSTGLATRMMPANALAPLDTSSWRTPGRITEMSCCALALLGSMPCTRSAALGPFVSNCALAAPGMKIHMPRRQLAELAEAAADGKPWQGMLAQY